MKRIIFTLTILFAIGLTACRKNAQELDIKAYDQQQIQKYIAANGITGMVQDTSGRDSTGIWYKIIAPGSGPALDYPDTISYVYTLKSFDNLYNQTDTVADHVYGFVGHVAPNGLMLAIRNDMKYRGAKMRVLVPSHLAYGVNGLSSGSTTVANGRIAGNQCLDYTLSIISNQAAYDDMVIQNYMTANSLTGYTKTADGLYYKITKAGTGTTYVNDNSVITLNYTGQLMNNTFFDNSSATTTATFSDVVGLTSGFREGIKLVTTGGINIFADTFDISLWSQRQHGWA